MDLMGLRRSIMLGQKKQDSDLLHYMTRTKSEISGGNGNIGNRILGLDYNAWYALIAGNYYSKDTSNNITITNGILDINPGISASYGAGFPVKVSPGTTYYLSATLENCRINIAQYKANGDFLNALSNVQNAMQFTTGTGIEIVNVLFVLSTRYEKCTAQNMLMSTKPFTN